MHQNKEKLTENYTIPLVSEIYTTKSINEKTQVCSWIAFCRKAKTKEETSSLRNLKNIPRNLNEIVLSWIPSQ
jgi:hypothetical protein